MQLSARNQIAATVKNVKLGGVLAEVTVQIAGGQELVSLTLRRGYSPTGSRFSAPATAGTPRRRCPRH